MRNLVHLYNKVVKTLLLLTSLLAAHSIHAQAAFTGSGSGTTESPYEITNEAQLKEIANNLPAHYKLMNDIALTTAWTPIGLSGNSVANFTGSLNGVGHLISGLTVPDGASAGLFASNAGTIKNLGVAVAEAGITGQYAGGIAGKNANAATITNCYTTGAFVSTKNAWSSAGGIVGQNEGLISSCYTTVDEIRFAGTSSYNYFVGGIAGETTSTASIRHCLVLCKKIDLTNGKGMVKVDRIAGSQSDLSGTPDNNTNFYGYDLKVTLPNYSSNQPFGIPGLLWNSSFAEGNTSWAFDEAKENFYLKTTDGVQMGTSLSVANYRYLQGEGTAAAPYEISTVDDFKRMSVRTNQNYSQETDKHYKLMQAVTISEEFLQISATRSFNGMFDGNGQTVKMTKLPSNPDAYRRYGLFGKIGGNSVVKDLHIDCNVDLDVSNETGDNNLYLGALYSTNESTGEHIVENCYVTGTLTVKCAKIFGIGGLAGTCVGGIIRNCYTDVDIKVSTTSPANSSSFYAGGIAGNITNTGSIQNCYAKGKIEMNANSYLRAGGISGIHDGPAPKNCLALNQAIIMTSAGDSANMSNSRITTKGYWQEYETIHNNYASSKMALFKKGTAYTPVSDTEEAGDNKGLKKYLENDGADWNGELPSDQWEKTADGYVNLKSIRQTFELQQQIKLADYVPFTITLPATTPGGTITSTPEKGAFAGDTVKLTITPDWGYRLKSDTIKVTGAVTDTVKFDMTDSSFVMPAQAITISAEFVLDSLRLADITTGDSLLILQKNAAWFYQIKNTVMTKSLSLDTDIPFNGIISGTLPADKTLSFEPGYNGELVLDEATVSSLVIKEGANIILSSTSKLTYTEIHNEGGNLIAREGAEIASSISGQVKMGKLTITTPQNGTLAVRVGNTVIASGDMLAIETKFSVTATPASGYETESLSVKTGSGDVVATGGLYTMPETEVTVSATFKSTYVPPVPTVYYTVTLPTVEGATTNPQAGSYQVEEGYNFSFSLKLEAGYGHSVPVVTANGTVLTPRPNDDGKYIIYNITADTEILISGIVPDAPTSNAEIKSDAIRIRSTAGTLLISTPTSSSLEIYTTSGSRIHQSNLPTGDSQIQLSEGLYIIKVGKYSQKVFIR